jgi:hypothetical protein
VPAVSAVSRVPAGTGVRGGQFAATQHTDPDMDLPAPAESFDERIQRERIDAPWGWDTFAATIGEYEARELYDTHHGSLGAAMADRLSTPMLPARSEDPWEGTSARDRIRAGMNAAAAQHGLTPPNPVPDVQDVQDGAPVPVEHPAVQGGAVFDSVSVDDQVFHRRQDKVYPGEPYAIRLQANRPLTDDEARHVAGAMGYAYRSTVAGEPLGMPERDTPYSFVVSADTTKSARDDLGVALEAFEDMMPTMINEGSSVRKTDRAGAGTKGTRLIEGMHEPDLAFEVYYDSVFDDRRTQGTPADQQIL